MPLQCPSTVPPFEVKRWTLEEYRRLIADGYFDEDGNFELLEGWIVPKMPRGIDRPDH